ncbi:MAG: hypothetical protein ACKVOB_10550 [Sphingomonas sp.]
MRYYAVGLALQKGLAIALLPLIVLIFGRETFSNYALLMSTVQLYGTVSGLGVPLAVLPLWFRSPDPLAAVRMMLGIVAMVAALAAALLCLIGVFLGRDVVHGVSAAEAALWIAAVALLYNVNLIAFSVARSQGRQMAFVLANVFGGLVLLVGLFAAYLFQVVSLRALTLAQMAALAACSVPLLGLQIVRARGVISPGFREQATALMRFSVPLMTNSVLLLLAMNVDKWAALAFFTKAEFSSYIIDYQMGFAILFVPAVVALHYGPIFAALVADGNEAALAREERQAQKVVVAGWAVIAVIAYCYALLTGLKLTPGYWVLSLTFLFQGLYLIKSNQLMAQMRSARLFFASMVSLIFFSAILLIAGKLHSLPLLYGAYPLYDALLLALISRKTVRLSAS